MNKNSIYSENDNLKEDNVSVFLYIKGDDDSFAFCTFEGEFDENDVYKDMINAGKEETILTSKDGTPIYVYILKFKSVDDNFINFVRDTFFDYDESKHRDIIRIK